MEQKIKKILLALRLDFMAMWIIAVILVVSGEMGVWVDCMIEPHSNDEFVLSCVCIALTVVGLPLGMKLFTLNTTNSLRRMNKDEALHFYFVWNVVRFFFIMACVYTGLISYYLTLNSTGALCACIGLCLSLYCWPSRGRIDNYLDSINNAV